MAVMLVTGASRGIGRAVVRAAAADGVDVLAAARSEEGLAATAEGAGPGRVVTARCDVRSSSEAGAAVARAVECFGRLDVVVCNAGLFRTAPLLETSLELWESVLRTNLDGAFHVARAAAKVMLEAGQGGTIAMVSSVAGRVGFPGSTAYCASKFGMLGLAAAMREELRPHRIHVLSVLPAEVDTDAWDSSGLDLAALGLDRARMMKPEDVGRAIVDATIGAKSARPEELVLRPPLT